VLTEAGDAAVGRAPGSAARWYGAALRLLGDEDAVALQRASLLSASAGALAATGRFERVTAC
jgi:hypothetical protein